MAEHHKGPQKETIGDKIRGFGNFVFNKEEGTVLGRNGKSWAEIGLFYCIYYACLAGFFAAALTIFYQLVDEKTPRLTGADSLLKANPALGFRPMPDVETTLIRFSDKESSYQKYVDHLTSFLKAYESQPDTVDCVQGNEPRHESQHDKACFFNTDQLDPCNAANKFGYAEGKPCVLIKLNRVFDWQPEPYSEKANDTAALPGPLQGKNLYSDYFVTVMCTGQNPADQDDMGNLIYKPNSGFPYKYFPYINQKGYVSPLVMVKFENPKVQTLLMIECRAWAKNIKYDKLELDGAIHFELLVDFPPNITTTAGK